MGRCRGEGGKRVGGVVGVVSGRGKGGDRGIKISIMD